MVHKAPEKSIEFIGQSSCSKGFLLDNHNPIFGDFPVSRYGKVKCEFWGNKFYGDPARGCGEVQRFIRTIPNSKKSKMGNTYS